MAQPANELPDPSFPLNWKKHEMFCIYLVAGNTLQRAWQMASRPHAPDTLKEGASRSQGFKVKQRPEVAARLDYLLKQRSTAPETATEAPTRAELMETLEHVTIALMTLHEAAQRHGAKHVDLTRIRRSTTLHTGRIARLAEGQPPEPKRGPMIDLKGAQTRLFKCKCDCP